MTAATFDEADADPDAGRTRCGRPPDPRLPDAVETPRAKLVYRFLLIHGCASADRLAADLSIRKPALFPVLETLIVRGLVDTVEDGYVAL